MEFIFTNDRFSISLGLDDCNLDGHVGRIIKREQIGSFILLFINNFNNLTIYKYSDIPAGVI